MKKTTNPKRYALIGNPVSHSFTPLIHSLFAKQLDIRLDYQAITCQPEQLNEKIQQLIHEDYAGVNITLPYKQAAITLATHASDYATQAQAATLLDFKEDQEIFAENFDGVGLVEDLKHNYNYSFTGKSILIIGAGGAAHGIIGALLEQTPRAITIANRTASKAINLAAQFNTLISVQGQALSELGSEAFDLIIQASSAGLTGPTLQLPSNLVYESSWCYNLLYAQQAEPFCTWARNAGAEKVLTGLGMVVEQAAASFYLWHGIYPDTAAVMSQLTAQTID